MTNKCPFNMSSFAEGFYNLIDPLVWGDLVNEDGSELKDD